MNLSRDEHKYTQTRSDLSLISVVAHSKWNLLAVRCGNGKSPGNREKIDIHYQFESVYQRVASR